jgi:predicted nucleotidyltransferase
MYSQERFYGKIHSASVLLMKTVSKPPFGNKRSHTSNRKQVSSEADQVEGAIATFGSTARDESDIGAMERIIKYSRQEWSLCDCGDLEEPLSTFLYDLPNLTVCNVFPPLHILNILLLKGWVGGSMSPNFIWKPFEISEQEYQEILPKLLDPNWAVLCKKLWRIRLPMKIDPDFDGINDRDIWIELVSEKHRVKSL